MYPLKAALLSQQWKKKISSFQAKSVRTVGMKQMISCVYTEHSEQNKSNLISQYPLQSGKLIVADFGKTYHHTYITKRVLTGQTHFIKIFFHSISVLTSSVQREEQKGIEVANERQKVF